MLNIYMSLERVEGQPLPEPRLLKPPPEILLLTHEQNLKKNLQTKVGTIIFENSELIATQAEYEKKFSTDKIGHIYIHNKRNGLPDAAIEYRKKDDQMFMETAHYWLYNTIEDPEPSCTPMLVATEFIVKKPFFLKTYPTEVRKTILDTDNGHELLWGEGNKKNLVRNPSVLYDQAGNELFTVVKKEISKLPGFRSANEA